MSLSVLVLTASLQAEAAISSGWAFETSGSDLPSAGIGVGTRVGVALERFYFGLQATHHLGSTASAEGPGTSYAGHYSASYVGVEGGFDFHPWKLLVRPWLGAGAFVARGQTTVSELTVTDNHIYPYASTGCIVAYDFKTWFAGVDVRGVVVPAERFNRTELGAFATIAIRF